MRLFWKLREEGLFDVIESFNNGGRLAGQCCVDKVLIKEGDCVAWNRMGV